MIKSLKIRLYPTKEQEILMKKHIGACRFIWNYMLKYQKILHDEQNGKYLSKFGMMNLITDLKKQDEYLWLNEISRTSLNVICKDLDTAFQNFFNKIYNHPKFKSKKRNKLIFPIRYDSMYFNEKEVNVEKIGKIKYKTDYNLPIGKGICKFTDPRVSYINNKWILSFGMECENQTFQLTDNSMGIDLGIKELAVVAFGNEKFIFHNINKSKKISNIKQKIKHLQKDICRKYEVNKQNGKYIKTKNILKQEEKLRKLYTKWTNIRMDYLHKTTHFLVSRLPKRIVMENLNVEGMIKNKHLSKAIHEQCFYEFKRQIKYKCEFYGIEFVEVDRFYPSSKTCCECGNIKKDLTLSDRIYTCECCGNVIDRDLNAAINLMRYED